MDVAVVDDYYLPVALDESAPSLVLPVFDVPCFELVLCLDLDVFVVADV